MSYTYRTDKLLDEIGNAQGFVNQRNCPRQWVGLAIELETELQEARFEIERLTKVNLHRLEQEMQELRVLNEHLRNRTGQLNDRIRHLIRLGLETSQYGATKYRELWEQEEEL